MRRELSIFVVGCCTSLISSCINIEPALSGKAYDDYIKSIKPYALYWVKDGGSEEQRRLDSWACGAAKTIHAADHVVFTQEEVRQAKRPEDPNDIAAYFRLQDAWAKCMQTKGYRRQK